jgi:hypothetical protein
MYSRLHGEANRTCRRTLNFVYSLPSSATSRVRQEIEGNAEIGGTRWVVDNVPTTDARRRERDL